MYKQQEKVQIIKIKSVPFNIFIGKIIARSENSMLQNYIIITSKD